MVSVCLKIPQSADLIGLTKFVDLNKFLRLKPQTELNVSPPFSSLWVNGVMEYLYKLNSDALNITV